MELIRILDCRLNNDPLALALEVDHIMQHFLILV